MLGSGSGAASESARGTGPPAGTAIAAAAAETGKGAWRSWTRPGSGSFAEFGRAAPGATGFRTAAGSPNSTAACENSHSLRRPSAFWPRSRRTDGL